MSETIITKRCCTCKEIKSIDKFGKNRCIKNGIRHQCKLCEKTYKQSKKGKATNKHYAQSKKGRIVQKRSACKYNSTQKGRNADRCRKEISPEKTKARSVIGNAIASGQFPKINTQKCFCGEQAQEYHHDKGYEPKHWFDVVPKCVKCHRHIHNGNSTN